MTKGIINGLMRIIKPLEPYCDSTKCDIPQFVSMGICSHCADITAQAHRSCEPTDYYFFWPFILSKWQETTMSNCTYTTPRDYQLTLSLKNLMTSSEINSAQHSANFLSFSVTYWSTIIGTRRQMERDAIVALLAVDLPMTLVTYHPVNVTTIMPMPTLTECSVYYCENNTRQALTFLASKRTF